MSVSYWGITGYGIDLDDIRNSIDEEKVYRLVKQLVPNEIFGDNVFEDNTFYGCPYESFGEFLSELDDTNTILWEDGGENDSHYFLYIPKYPWQVSDKDPKNPKEIEDRIVKVLLKICNESEESLRSKIGFVSDFGYG